MITDWASNPGSDSSPPCPVPEFARLGGEAFGVTVTLAQGLSSVDPGSQDRDG